MQNNVQGVRYFGTEYRYSLRPGKSGWGVTSTVKIKAEWMEFREILYPKYQALFDVRWKEIGPHAARREVAIKHIHEVMQTLAKRHNFMYRRSKWRCMKQVYTVCGGATPTYSLFETAKKKTAAKPKKATAKKN
jgi:hypothetical protein